jgi:hypothetical protein
MKNFAPFDSADYLTDEETIAEYPCPVWSPVVKSGILFAVSFKDLSVKWE